MAIYMLYTRDMSPDIVIAAYAGLGGMLGWGLADFFAKKTIDEIGDIVSLVVAHVLGTVLIFLFVVARLTQGTKILVPHELTTWSSLVFFGAVQATVYLLVYRGFGKGQLAILNPLFATYSGLVALISVLFLGEAVSPTLAIGLFVVFTGVVLLNLDAAAFQSRKLAFVKIPGFREILIATGLATLWTLGWNDFIRGQDWLSLALWMYVFMTITLLAYAAATQTSLRFDNRRVWKYLFFIAVFETCAYVAISYGFSLTSHTSIVALLSGAFSLPTIVLARVFLKEKVTLIQTVGTLVIVSGIILVSIV